MDGWGARPLRWLSVYTCFVCVLVFSCVYTFLLESGWRNCCEKKWFFSVVLQTKSRLVLECLMEKWVHQCYQFFLQTMQDVAENLCSCLMEKWVHQCYQFFLQTMQPVCRMLQKIYVLVRDYGKNTRVLRYFKSVLHETWDFSFLIYTHLSHMSWKSKVAVQ